MWWYSVIYIFIREVLLIYWCVIQDNTRLDGRLFLSLALSSGTLNEKPYRYFFRQNSLLLFSMSSVHWQRLHFFWCVNNWTNLSVVVFLKYSLKKYMELLFFRLSQDDLLIDCINELPLGQRLMSDMHMLLSLKAQCPAIMWYVIRWGLVSWQQIKEKWGGIWNTITTK